MGRDLPAPISITNPQCVASCDTAYTVAHQCYRTHGSVDAHRPHAPIRHTVHVRTTAIVYYMVGCTPATAGA